MVFLIASGCATRVQRICKKLQTVRGAGWPAAWSLFPGHWGVIILLMVPGVAEEVFREGIFPGV